MRDELLEVARLRGRGTGRLEGLPCRRVQVDRARARVRGGVHRLARPPQQRREGLGARVGQTQLDEAGVAAEESGLVTFRSEWSRIEGEVFAETRTPAEAEERIRAAIDFAASHGLRLFELRAQVSLCRFLSARGEVSPGDRQRLSVVLDEVAAAGQCLDVDTARGILVAIAPS